MCTYRKNMGGGGWRNQKKAPFSHRPPALDRICFFVVVFVCFVFFSLLCVLCAHLSACCTPYVPLPLLLFHCLVFFFVVHAYLSSEGGSRRDVLLVSLCLLLYVGWSSLSPHSSRASFFECSKASVAAVGCRPPPSVSHSPSDTVHPTPLYGRSAGVALWHLSSPVGFRDTF